jgi:hypothetical protein
MKPMYEIVSADDVAGKTVEQIFDNDENASITFDDGTAIVFSAVGGYHAGEATLEIASASDVEQWSPWVLRALGLISAAECVRATDAEIEQRRRYCADRDRAEFERLKNKHGW